MLYTYFLPLLAILTATVYFSGARRAKKLAGSGRGAIKLHSLPGYYGTLNAIGCALPVFCLYLIFRAAEPYFLMTLVVKSLPKEMVNVSAAELSLILNDIKNVVSGDIVAAVEQSVIQQAADNYLRLQKIWQSVVGYILFALFLVSAIVVFRKISPSLRARNSVEKIIECFLILCSAVAILTTIGIVFSVLFEAVRFFQVIDLVDFIFGLEWSPQTAIREDQSGSSGSFGAIPLFVGTMLIAGIAMMVAIPIGLMSAIFLSEYAGPRLRTIVKPLLEILAGIPTVVYGFFAALSVAPFIRETATLFDIPVASESALAAGAVMGIMIIPFVSSLSDDVIHAVPQSLRDGSLALGATHYETIRSVVIPAALPGIVGGILLAVSRAIGETMIVVMAAGLSANLTVNPFQAVTTVTVQIVTLLVGDQEFDSPKTLAAFALGLILFLFTLTLNFIALIIVRKYREQYE